LSCFPTTGGRVDRHQFGQHLVGAVLIEYAWAEGCSTSRQSEGLRQAKGFCIVGSALDQAKAAALKARLVEVADDLEAACASTHPAIIDPDRANVRVFGVPDHDPHFLQLASALVMREVVEACLIWSTPVFQLAIFTRRQLRSEGENDE
jgi:hypothetical protein